MYIILKIGIYLSVVIWDVLNFFVVCILVFDEYRNISKKDIVDSIKGELFGYFEDLLLVIGKFLSVYKLSYFVFVLN